MIVFTAAIVAGLTKVSLSLPSLRMREVLSVVMPQPSASGPAKDFTFWKSLTEYSYSVPCCQISWYSLHTGRGRLIPCSLVFGKKSGN